jgi:hypothetical protein
VAGLDASVQVHRVKGRGGEAEGRGTVNWTVGYDTICCIGMQWCPERSKSGGGEGLTICKFILYSELVDSGVRRSEVK